MKVYSKYFITHEIVDSVRDSGFIVAEEGVFLIPPRILSFTLIPAPILTIMERMERNRCLKSIFAVRAIIGYKDDALMHRQ